jgi:hypothetical protein
MNLDSGDTPLVLLGPAWKKYGAVKTVFVVDGYSGQVLQYDGTTGAPVGTGVFVPAGSAK